MNFVFILLLSVYILQTTLAQITDLPNPLLPYGLQSRFDSRACGLIQSGWSEWMPQQCTQCSQSRFRYCKGVYSGCGEWYCLGNRIDSCKNTCLTPHSPDPRVRISGTLPSAECGSRATFSCPACYRVVGANGAECLPDSSWSHDTPVCEPVTCPTPPKLQNGYVDWGSNCGSQATYRCLHGYELLGPAEQVCSTEGTWDPPGIPICIPLKCPLLIRPQHGFILQMSRNYRARAYFRCRMGYDLIGSRSIRCSARGSWSPAPPSCLKSPHGW